MPESSETQNRRSYTKEEKGLEVKHPLSKTASSSFQESQPLNAEIATPRLYFKAELNRDYNIIYLVLEDKKRTYQYFEPIIEKQKQGFVVKAIRNENSGIPAGHMAEEAARLSFTEGDELFLVCDLDHYRSDLLALHPDCLAKKWNLIISNPCIEIWLWYHFCPNKPTLTLAPHEVERHYSRKMKTECGKLNNGRGIDPRTKNIKRLTTAIVNSEANFSLESNSIIPNLYSTQMHILANRIKDFIDLASL